MTRKGILAAALVLLTACAQWAGSNHLRLLGVHPDLLLCAALFFALTARPPAALGAAWSIGLLKALCSSGSFGADPLLFTLVALAVLGLRRALFVRHPLSQVLLALPLATAADAGGGLLLVAQGCPLSVGRIAIHAVAAGVYTALAAPGVVLVLAKLVGVSPTSLHTRAAGG